MNGGMWMPDDVQRVAITGAAGFIGSHVADWLIARGLEVYGSDDLSGGTQENVPEGCRFSVVDVRDQLAVEAWIGDAQPHVVYHLAADATEGRSQFTPISATARNYMGYMHVLTSAIRAGASKMVLVSSISVYGAQQPPFTEQMPRAPVDIYGLAKASSEHATEIMSEVHRIRYTVLRPHNVYGPRQRLNDPYRNVVGIFITRAMQGLPVYIYGDGEQRRSYTYIDQCAPLIGEAGLRFDTDGEAVNIGSDATFSINELVGALEHALGRSIEKEYVPDRPQEVKMAWCDHAKQRRIFENRPETSLGEGLRRMVEWARTVPIQPMRYEPLEIDAPNAPVTWTKKMI